MAAIVWLTLPAGRVAGVLGAVIPLLIGIVALGAAGARLIVFESISTTTFQL